jgi:DNA-binding MarR family transcriptional regulator
MTEPHEKISVWLKAESIQILEEIQKQHSFPTREDALDWLIHEWGKQQPQTIREKLEGAGLDVANESVRRASEYANELAELLRQAGIYQAIDKTKEWAKTLPLVRLDMVKELLEQPSGLEDFLEFRRKQETEAIHKLSLLQKDILRKIFLETDGYRAVKWTPQEWFGAKEPSERAAFSTSLKRLESRGLVERQAVDKREQPKRTSVVKLTDLGHRVAKRLTITS